MQTKIYNQKGEIVQEIELNSKIFEVAVKPEVVHQVATSLLSSRRTPVANTKTRGEVRGGGKKPWQQKGTGRARAGSNRSPLWRGGGITFGPRANRNFERKINKKQKTLGLFSVLSDRATSGQLVVLDNLALTAAKTNQLAGLLKDLQTKIPTLPRKFTIIISDKEKDIARAGKNLPNIAVMNASSLSVLDLLSKQGIIVTRNALGIIEKTYLKQNLESRI